MAKGNRVTTDFRQPDNKKRALTKKDRDKGVLAMKEAKMNQSEWTRNHDPLYNIKGKERHKRLTSH